jgi:outer membrane protein assembly factor BamB
MGVKKLVAIGMVLMGGAVAADDWPQFRGVNASGVSASTGLPVEFGPKQNVVWKTALPPGHSSPVLTRDRIFVNGWETDKLATICLDRATGKILWRSELARPRTQELHKANSPTSSSPVTDGRNVYVFFGDFGLLSYGPDGHERWRLPLGPFNNPFGMGASPVLAGDKLLMICDSETGSFFVAVDKETGKLKWRVERSEYTRGFSTPVLYQPKGGPLQVIVSGSLQLTSYSVDTGEPLWWVRGSTWQMKSTPVLDGDTIYVHGWAGGADVGQQEEIPPFEEVLKKWDANGDGRLARAEVADPRAAKDWNAMDLDRDGALGERDWAMYRSRRSVQNAVRAIRLGGRGDMTDHSIRWRYLKSLPNVPSPLLYKNVLYLMKEGGILTTLDPASGEVLKQARLTGAPGDYFASPVGADDKVYTVSEACHVTVLKAGGEWEILAVNDLDDSCNATPAIADGRIYLRTRSALYCFAK